MSAAKSYTNLKDNWRIVRLEAVNALKNYVLSRNNDDYAQYRKNIGILENLEWARQDLLKPHYNYARVESALKVGRYDYNDIPNMISLFRRIQGFSLIKQIITIWAQASGNIIKLDSLGTNIHSQILSGNHNEATQTFDIVRINDLNDKLDTIHTRISSRMEVTAVWIKNTLWEMTLGIAVTLLLIGGISTTMILKNSRRMRLAKDENEQRFHSLFSQNSNAVFLMDLKGHILNANKAATHLTGYTPDQLKEMELLQIVIPEYRSLVSDNFKKATGGVLRRIIVDGQTGDNRTFTMSLSNTPIYVNGKCTGIFGVAENVTERKIQEKKIQDNLNEKEVLLAEIHHRVKNNLALISGLLDLQQQYSDKPELTSILTDARRRVHSMAKVHELLYHESSLSHIELRTYINNLAEIISATFTDMQGSIQFEIVADPLKLSIIKAIPFGLILNELITNAYKHSFDPGKQGTIYINLKHESNLVTLSVLTDGKPLPENFKIENHQTLGMTLIRMLSVQIDAKVEMVHTPFDGFQIKFDQGDQ